MKNFRLILWVLVALVAVAFVTLQLNKADERSSYIQDPTPDVVRGYSLTSHEGKMIQHTDLAGTYTMIYFGYSFCPTFCPTDLARMSAAIRMLEAEGRDLDFIQPIFITIDPHRDTVAQMADTVSLYHPKMLGLTGSEAEVRAVADTFQVFYEKAGDPDADADYLMNHMNIIFLMDGESRRIHMFGKDDTAEDIANVLREISESL